MTPLIDFLNSQPIVLTFLTIGAGLLLGKASVKGISLGASAVLFVALALGHLGASLPTLISQIGIALFVYAVGLQAGPRFFKSFRSSGLRFAALAVVTLASGALAAVACGWFFGLGGGLTSGIYAGSLTTTPGLAAAIEAVPRSEAAWVVAVSVGYGIAYPFGVAGVVLFVQLLPRLLKLDLHELARGEQGRAASEKPRGAWVALRNAQLEGMTVGEFLSQGLAQITITRIEREGGELLLPSGDTVLQRGDSLRIVAKADDLRRVTTVIGPVLEEKPAPAAGAGPIVARDYFVTEEKLTGRTLRELHLREVYGVVIARLWREEIEFIPDGRTELQVGDLIRVVGTPEDCDRFQTSAGHSEKKLQQTEFIPLCLGLALGVALGLIPISLPGTELEFKLGMAGGPLFVALIAGHFGRIGPLSIRMPMATKIFVRELGLLFFLAGAGIAAGAGFWEVVSSRGAAVLVAGAIVTIVPMAAAWTVARWWLKLDVLSALGAICGGMTSTPGLGAVTSSCDSESPAIAYATVYPVALILVTLFAQVMARGLFAWVGV